MSDDNDTSEKSAPPRVILIPRWFLIVSHFLVPAVGVFVAYLHLREHVPLTWELLVLTAFIALPFLLPLIAFYVASFSEKGVVFKSVAVKGNQPADAVEALAEKFKRTIRVELVELAPTMSATGPISAKSAAKAAVQTFDQLIPGAQKVLRTLWRFQGETFGEKSDRRWGFKVQPGMDDYTEFRTGVTQLLISGLVAEDSRGLVFLTNEGIAFCQTHRESLGPNGDMWTKFSAA